MSPRSLSRTAVVALLWICSSASCHVSWGLGANYPAGRSDSQAGGHVAMDVGLAYDFRRRVRLAVAESFQMFGGGVFTADGQSVIVPLPHVVELQVTAYSWPEQIYLRGTARAYWGSSVRIGPRDDEVAEPGSRAYGGLLGATLMVAGDHEGLGPTSLYLTAGVLVARADTEALGRLSFVTPMLILGSDFFPPLVLYCWLLDEKCPHHLKWK